MSDIVIATCISIVFLGAANCTILLYRFKNCNQSGIDRYLHISVPANILTSTKNASLIITDFLAMIHKNEQPHTASLCRGWVMFENDFNLICR